MQDTGAGDRICSNDDIFIDASAQAPNGASSIAFAADLEVVSKRNAPISGARPRVKTFRARVSLITRVCLTAVVAAQAELQPSLASRRVGDTSFVGGLIGQFRRACRAKELIRVVASGG